MKKVNFSLIIPTFNRSDLICETIDSALNQTTPFTEIIVVDDGSNDDTPAVLKRYLNLITVIATNHEGVQAARNKGAAAANGTHLVFCDSDDLLEPQYVEIIGNWVQNRTEHNVIYSNFKTFDQTSLHSDKFSQAPSGFFDGGKTHNFFTFDIPDLHIRTLEFQPFFPSALTIKRSTFHNLEGFNVAMNKIPSEDWEFTLRALTGGCVAICKLPLVRIRKHKNNESYDGDRQTSGEALVLEYALEHHCYAKNWKKEIEDSIQKRRLISFDGYFSKRDFAKAYEIDKLIVNKPIKFKFWLKHIIVMLLWNYKNS